MNFLDEIGECVPREYKTSKESEEVALLLKQGLSQGASRGLETVRFVRKSAWDQLNIGVYSDIDPLWRQVWTLYNSFFDEKHIQKISRIGFLWCERNNELPNDWTWLWSEADISCYWRRSAYGPGGSIFNTTIHSHQTERFVKFYWTYYSCCPSLPENTNNWL